MASRAMPGSVATQQDNASSMDPAQLVGQFIEVDGIGVGRVVSFNKRSTMSFTKNSTHLVAFVKAGQQEPDMQTLVLRRRKMGQWNNGRRFRLAAAVAAAPPIAPSRAAGAAAAAASTTTASAASEAPAPEFMARKTAAFLSHFKIQAGTEARLVHDKLKQSMGDVEIFLDSDDLQDLRLLLDHVRASNVLVLLQTKSVLERPWVILELYTAITSDVPICGLNIQNAFPYDYGVALDFLTYFDKEIEIANPGAAALLLEHGVDPVDVAYRLSTVLPSIISTDFNPNGSANAINAAMMDLQAAMARAAPFPVTIGKEEWLEKRGTVPRAVRRASKPHGKGADSLTAAEQSPATAAAPSDEFSTAAAASGSLANLPSTVPELPNAYLVREGNLEELKKSLLADQQSSTTTIASQKRNKVGAHGMGGIGKTTIAAALVHDDAIRSSFQKIVWVSVGQEPDLRELQESIYAELTESAIPDWAATPELVVSALQRAAKDSLLLLVLDDVWDSRVERSLNCIDPDNGSRLLVTTRIRGLLSNTHEVDVGLLSEQDALSLLLTSAEMDSVAEGGEEHRRAKEIVELCGRLPLTLALAGGMLAANPDGAAEDILEAMKESHGADLEDEEGRTLEERVIETSLKILKKQKAHELTERVFLAFAAFPEDVAVPAAFFNKLAPVLAGDESSERKARLAVGSSLKTLFKYNLLKGSLLVGQGVFMHDIVRDYVISRHTPDELIALQKKVVDTTLAARPEPGGFPAAEFTRNGTFEGYCARHLYWHFRYALQDGEEPPEAWLSHPDVMVAANVTMAVGMEKLSALSKSHELAGELVQAARLSFLATRRRHLDAKEVTDLTHRSVALLERADDLTVQAFEEGVLMQAFLCEPTSDRQRKAMDRVKVLASSRPASGYLKYLESLTYYTDYADATQDPDGPFDVDKGLDILRKAIACQVEASNFKEVPQSLRMQWKKTSCGAFLGFNLAAGSQNEKWNPNDFGGSEAGLVEYIDFYDYNRCGRIFKELTGYDPLRMALFIGPLALFYGNIPAVDVWFEKVVASNRTLDLPSTLDYNVNEAYNLYSEFHVAMPALLLLDATEKVQEMLETLGFTWDKTGLERLDMCIRAFSAFYPLAQDRYEVIYARLIMLLSFPKEKFDLAEVNEWMPSPKELREMEKTDSLSRIHCSSDLSSHGARAFLKLGRDEDAYELASLAVDPEDPSLKLTTLTSCHSLLGQVAAKRGALDEADGHFANAVKEAKRSRLPMLEAIAALDWKQFLLEPHGRGCQAAEDVIDAACTKMGKARSGLGVRFAADEGKRGRGRRTSSRYTRTSMTM